MSFQFFLTTIRQGLFARQNNYDVVIVPPAGSALGSIGGAIYGYNLNLRCETISIPERSVSSNNDDIRVGPGREHAYNVTYGPISATFLCDNILSERRFFQNWQELAFDKENYTMGYYNDYTGTMYVSQKDDRGIPWTIIEVEDVYPKTIAAHEFSTSSQDLQRLTVDFVYRRWTQKL